MSQPLKPNQCHKIFYDTFSLNLKYYRNRLGMTQVQIAERAGITAKYVSLLESAFFNNVPSFEVVFCLADALEVAPYKLFKPLS
jgi:transcriptional regulator with XRE-family HTH domain